MFKLYELASQRIAKDVKSKQNILALPLPNLIKTDLLSAFDNNLLATVSKYLLENIFYFISMKEICKATNCPDEQAIRKCIRRFKSTLIFYKLKEYDLGFELQPRLSSFLGFKFRVGPYTKRRPSSYLSLDSDKIEKIKK